jgi:uroporphyrinogen-III synthase
VKPPAHAALLSRSRTIPVVARILVLRSGGDHESDAISDDQTDILRTHQIVGRFEGVDEVRGFDANPDSILVVSSPTTVRLLRSLGEDALFALPFGIQIAAGASTASMMVGAGAPEERVIVPARPGASGILASLPEDLTGKNVLWPRGADADAAPLQELRRRGAKVVAPVIYEKRRAAIERSASLDWYVEGLYQAVVVSSLAALDAFQDALRASGRPEAPPVRWGVLGSETAKGVVARGLPQPLVATRASIGALIQELRSEQPS